MERKLDGPMTAREAPDSPYQRGRPRQMFVKEDSSYQPTKAELEEDMRVDATPEELAQALFGKHPRRRSASE